MFEHWRNFGGGMKHLTSAARQTKIRAQFAAPEGVSIPVLAREFGVSEMTIRRDLAALESRAQIRRTIYKDQANTDSSYGIFDGDVWCDSSGQVYTHSDNANDTIALGLYGWTDDRGQYQ